jgi:phosphocarrier protein
MNSTAEFDVNEPFAEDCPPAPRMEGGVSRELLICNRKGLHARATAKFVHCVDAFDADVRVTRCGETVGGTSIMGILTLGAAFGSTITVAAAGPQANDVLDAIERLVAARFGEDE